MNRTEKQITTAPGSFALRKRIGSTVYEVNCYFNPDAKETIDDKILRLVRNDLNLAPGHVTMGLPQTGRLSERGSP